MSQYQYTSATSKWLSHLAFVHVVFVRKVYFSDMLYYSNLEQRELLNFAVT